MRTRTEPGNPLATNSIRPLLAWILTLGFTAASGAGSAPPGSAPARLSSPSPWRFAVVGDSHVGASSLLAEMVPAMVGDGVDLVLLPGDMVNAGLGVTPAELRAQFGAWKEAVAPLVAAGIGIYPVRGNHEADAPDNLAVWGETFTGVFTLPADDPTGETGLTYSFTHKNALFVGLDEYVAIHRVNQAWLDSRLSSRGDRSHIFVFGHEPAFKVFHTDCMDDFPAERDTFWRSLVAGGARVYLCGHDHFFDAARIGDGTSESGDGIIQFTVGSGGGDLFDHYLYNGENSTYTPANLNHLEANGYLLGEVSGESDSDLGVTLTFMQRVSGVGGATYAPAYTYAYSAGPTSPTAGTFPVPDTGQTKCYGNSAEIACPQAGQPFYGQDSQCVGRTPGFTKSADGLTVRDEVTGLTWQQSPETDGDGVLDSGDKLTWAQAQSRPAALNAEHFGGYSDWRLPTIKELYSIIDFRGTDPNVQGTDTSGLTPFIDRTVFAFVYGDTAAGERVIDAQYWSATPYVSTTMQGAATEFGVNFADGRIKGYPRELGPGGTANRQFLRCVRDNPDYGNNNFTDNGDGTVSDLATGFMWAKADSGAAMNWQEALAWVQAKSAANYLGHADWRMPNAKELQSLVDYTRSPDTTGSAAIDPVLSCTAITNEGGAADFPWYWTGTTHVSASGSGQAGAYICFGRALGWMKLQGASCYTLLDVHGAGAQRSDPKSGNLAPYALGSACGGGTAYGRGPQGDVVRVSNFVRLVRDDGGTPPATLPGDCDGDGAVSIGEVQRAVNMFLGLDSPACGADCGADGTVSIGEVQKVINAFLGMAVAC